MVASHLGSAWAFVSSRRAELTGGRGRLRWLERGNRRVGRGSGHGVRPRSPGPRRRCWRRARRPPRSSSASPVTVTLNARVSWQIDLDGGASRTDVDLRGGQLSGIAFNAGSNLVTLALPRPHGSVPVQMAGGASDFQLSLPTGVPARVTAGGGASEVSLEGQAHTGVEGGSVFTTAGWAPGVAGFDIDATAGVSTITVTARAS
jgi:hypothetical protein